MEGEREGERVGGRGEGIENGGKKTLGFTPTETIKAY